MTDFLQIQEKDPICAFYNNASNYFGNISSIKAVRTIIAFQIHPMAGEVALLQRV